MHTYIHRQNIWSYIGSLYVWVCITETAGRGCVGKSDFAALPGFEATLNPVDPTHKK